MLLHSRRVGILVAPLLLAGSAIGGGCSRAKGSMQEVTAAATRRDIRAALDAQVQAWNRGDIDGFMAGYWRSEQLTFSSGGQVTRGWHATRERYHRRYGTRAKMGTLSFSDLEITPLGDRHAQVLGRYRLDFPSGGKPAGGGFTLVMAREAGGWVVTHDHTSGDPPAG